jgi:hypothetical protein
MYVTPIYHCYTHTLQDQGWKDKSEGSASLHMNSFAVQLETGVHSEIINILYHLISVCIHCNFFHSRTHFSYELSSIS